MRIYIDARYLGEEHVQQLQSQFPHHDFFFDQALVGTAEVIIAMPGIFLKHSLEEMKHLRFVQLLMAGFDRFDLDLAHRLGIIVANAQDVFSTTIAEDILTKIFFFNRHVSHYLHAMSTHQWLPIPKERELMGATFGFVGAGSIATTTAQRLKPFSVKLIAYRREQRNHPLFDEVYWGAEGLDALLRQSDYVIVAIPLTSETAHLLDRRRLLLMKNDALLINVSRGMIIDQEALIDMLREKRIRGAALDVVTPEPLPESSPLWELDNVYITPHNASSSTLMQSRLTALVEKNLKRLDLGEDPFYLI
jgi:phosphoglycerate dehydrogenase-like enzyme